MHVYSMCRTCCWVRCNNAVMNQSTGTLVHTVIRTAEDPNRSQNNPIVGICCISREKSVYAGQYVAALMKSNKEIQNALAPDSQAWVWVPTITWRQCLCKSEMQSQSVVGRTISWWSPAFTPMSLNTPLGPTFLWLITQRDAHHGDGYAITTGIYYTAPLHEDTVRHYR